MGGHSATRFARMSIQPRINASPNRGARRGATFISRQRFIRCLIQFFRLTLRRRQVVKTGLMQSSVMTGDSGGTGDNQSLPQKLTTHYEDQ